MRWPHRKPAAPAARATVPRPRSREARGSWSDLPDAGIPTPEPWTHRLATRGSALLAIAATASYLVWRATATLEGTTWWLSVPLFLLELQALGSLCLHAAALWDLDALRPPDDGVPAAARYRITVLIPTYDEPREVLLPTIAAAVALRPAHETWVLDDGDRPWLAELAVGLGARYVTRADHSHAKAGNINAALEHLDADLVAVLDADHIARADFLTATLSYFDDPTVALVQTPQDFYNEGSFEHMSRSRGRRFTEQELFYRAISAGRNRWNGAFWCGTNAVLRVAALRDVGGVAVDTITEDIHTTIRLHRRGWRTVFHNAVLARGLAAANAEQFLGQRRRWGTGAMQVLRKENPLVVRGLTVMQRVSYLGTLLGWFDSWRVLGYLLLAPATLLTAGLPVKAPPELFLVAFLTVFWLQQVALRALGRGRAPQLPSMVFDVVRLPANLLATLALAGFGDRSFNVTRKGREGDSRRRAPVPLLLLGLTVTSMVALAVFATHLAGVVVLPYPDPWVAWGAAGWTVFNLALLVAAVRRIRSLRYGAERRAAVRFDLTGDARLGDHAVSVGDVSLTGARLTLPASGGEPPDDLRPGLVTALSLPVGPETMRLDARVRSVWPSGDRWDVGVEFVDVSVTDAARLALALFRTGVTPRVVPQTRQSEPVRG